VYLEKLELKLIQNYITYRKKTGFNAVMTIRDILLNKAPKNNSEIKYNTKELSL